MEAAFADDFNPFTDGRIAPEEHKDFITPAPKVRDTAKSKAETTTSNAEPRTYR